MDHGLADAYGDCLVFDIVVVVDVAVAVATNADSSQSAPVLASTVVQIDRRCAVANRKSCSKFVVRVSIAALVRVALAFGFPATQCG